MTGGEVESFEEAGKDFIRRKSFPRLRSVTETPGGQVWEF